MKITNIRPYVVLVYMKNDDEELINYIKNYPPKFSNMSNFMKYILYGHLEDIKKSENNTIIFTIPCVYDSSRLKKEENANAKRMTINLKNDDDIELIEYLKNSSSRFDTTSGFVKNILYTYMEKDKNSKDS